MILCAAVSVLTSALTAPVLTASALSGDITLRFSHPTAQEVALRIDSLAPQRMTRASKDAWEIKLPELAPGVYTYNFYVGQTSFHDPNNPLRKPIHGGGFESILEVRGDGSQIWDRSTAPHGKLVEFKFRSEMFGETRTVMVYIPASRKRDQVLPVTYLLHGVMDDQFAWTRAGYADAVLENLIRAQRLKPRILVMPLGRESL